jgi:sporulation protein YlmC with PRC-barrel domain
MMKLILSLAAAAAIAIAVPAIAQQKTDAKTPIPKNIFLIGQAKGQYLARQRLIGQRVVNKDGQNVGEIEDVIIGEDNTVQGVIMGVGGVLGVGEKKIGVRYQALRFETKDGKTQISLPAATKDVIGALEPYKRTEPDKTLLQKASEAAKSAVDKAKEATGFKTDEAKKADEKK